MGLASGFFAWSTMLNATAATKREETINCQTTVTTFSRKKKKKKNHVYVTNVFVVTFSTEAVAYENAWSYFELPDLPPPSKKRSDESGIVSDSRVSYPIRTSCSTSRAAAATVCGSVLGSFAESPWQRRSTKRN